MIKFQMWGQSGHEAISASLCCCPRGQAEQPGRLEDNEWLESGQESTIYSSQNGSKFLGLRCCKREVAVRWKRLCNRSQICLEVIAVANGHTWMMMIWPDRTARLRLACKDRSTSIVTK